MDTRTDAVAPERQRRAALGIILLLVLAASFAATQITGSLAGRAIREFGIDTSTLHWDMTSMSVHGAYESEEQDPQYPQVTYGHSKDRRVDLKRIQAGLGVRADGGIPLLAKAPSSGAMAK